MTEVPNVELIEKFFTHPDGNYRFARWGRPQAPAIFGVDENTLVQMKETIITSVGYTGQQITEVDPDTGTNFMWFFCQTWDELLDAPGLQKLFPGIEKRVAELNEQDAHVHRLFAFDGDGAIRMATSFFRMQGEMLDVPTNVLAMTETIRALLLWADDAFRDYAPVMQIEASGSCLAKPEFTALLHAAYEPSMPAAASDPSHAMRLQARVAKLMEGGSA